MRSAAPRRPDRFPLSVRQGRSVVKIYATPVTVRGTVYEQFTVTYYLGDRRVRQRFSNLEHAKTEAQSAAVKLNNADHEALQLSPSDRAAYVRCLDQLRPLGISLTGAVADYVAALGLLPRGSSLVEAATQLARSHSSPVSPKSVAEVVAEMLDDRRSAGCSQAHLRDLEHRLGRFAAAFELPLSAVTAVQVRDYLRNLCREDGRPVTNRTRRNVQRIVTSLFHFGRKQRYVVRDLVDEIAEIAPPKAEVVDTGIFLPSQLRELLLGARDEIRAVLAIGAFCGVRTAELQRLDWGDVKLGERVLVIGAGKAKTAARRVVPMPENCIAWLKPLARPQGPVSPAPNDKAMSWRLNRIAIRQGIKWVKNGLRHSFCSYRLAVTHDPARVATEAGNSPAMIHRNYKALVTEAQGHEWFSILPDPQRAEPSTTVARG